MEPTSSQSSPTKEPSILLEKFMFFMYSLHTDIHGWHFQCTCLFSYLWMLIFKFKPLYQTCLTPFGFLTCACSRNLVKSTNSYRKTNFNEWCAFGIFITQVTGDCYEVKNFMWKNIFKTNYKLCIFYTVQFCVLNM